MLSVLTSENFEVKAIAENAGIGSFEGYASTFGNIDRVGDIVEKGAFVGAFRRAEEVRMLWAHSTSELIGGWKSIAEDSKGLFVKGELNLEVQRGREAYHLIKAGHLTQMSIGYKTMEYKDEMIGGHMIRRLTKLLLREVSLVSVPANTEAAITDVKHLLESGCIKNLNEILRVHSFSKSQTDIITGIVKKWMRDESVGVQPRGITGGSNGGDAKTEELRKAFSGFSFINS